MLHVHVLKQGRSKPIWKKYLYQKDWQLCHISVKLYHSMIKNMGELRHDYRTDLGLGLLSALQVFHNVSCKLKHSN